MALFKAVPGRRDLIYDTYSRNIASDPLPKYRLPDNQSLPSTVYSLIHDELLLDGNSRQNLATFCTTFVSPEAQQLMRECVDKNMIDQDEYPQTAEIEHRCVHILADLWNAPQAAATLGCSTTGSSEAAMLGGLALKWKFVSVSPWVGLTPGAETGGSLTSITVIVTVAVLLSTCPSLAVKVKLSVPL